MGGKLRILQCFLPVKLYAIATIHAMKAFKLGTMAAESNVEEKEVSQWAV